MEKARKRHLVVWRILRTLLKPWIIHKFNFKSEIYNVDGPYLVLCNHNTDWDPLIVSTAFPNQMYFVASEHIFRWGFVSRIIHWLVAPISRLKSRTGASTVMTVMRKLRDGANVCIFAEGEKSWNGITCPIADATGKLVRASGASLVTYRLEGGYFTHPRWAKTHRRGKMCGSVVGIYTPEMLKAMNPDEINDIINRDLYEDAYERQNEQQIAYNGKSLAEGLEKALCLCPECGKLETMRSRGNKFFCTACSFETTYTPEGYFTDGRFKTVREWDEWQQQQFEQLSCKAENGSIFSDEEFELLSFSTSHATVSLGKGDLTLYPDRLICAGEEWNIDEISGIALHGNQKLNLSAGDKDYEIVPRKTCCTRKYLTAFNALRLRKSGLVSR
ncbi:MAG: 1-acyl-sn-glycerol-3-phosphate acyltransferase [Oscillospiraceae bacterium]|nr:1-acyl-sn-glycerol-3-phosphate acyltransferase [Oscillospiraceae bacterium]